MFSQYRIKSKARFATCIVLIGLVCVITILSCNKVNAFYTKKESCVQVCVTEGDTLWTISGTVAPSSNRQEHIRKIEDINHLDSTTLHPGQVLLVPLQ